MSERPGRVSVVGSINADLVVRVPRAPRPGETVAGTSLARTGGGKGANQAMAAARAGGALTTFVGAVGADDDGRRLSEGLRRAGVTVALVTTDVAPTGTAIVTVDDTGENSIVVVSGANAWVDVDLSRAAIRSADVVLAQLEIPMGQVERAAELTPVSARFVLNAAPVADIPAAVWDRIDVLIVNEGEATSLAGASDLRAAIAVLGARTPCLVVTQGADGCEILVRGEVPVHVPAIESRAVDTTGAGDVFCGVFAAELAAGAPPSRAARRAVAAAAISVGREGAQPSIPSADEVTMLLVTAGRCPASEGVRVGSPGAVAGP